jgi:hypothetical protein
MSIKIIVSASVFCLSLSGCATLSDPEFLSALQGATQQLQSSAQVQQSFGTCVQSATTQVERNSCLNTYTQGLIVQ